MKRNIIFILTMALLGSIYPILSNMHTEATEMHFSDAESIVSEIETTTEVVADPIVEPIVETKAVIIEEPVVETVIEPVVIEPVVVEAPKPEPVVATTPAPVETPAPVQTPAPKEEPVYVAPVVQPDHIEVAGNWVNVYNVDSTALDASNSVYGFINTAKGYDGRFLYGHNSYNVFGGLKNLGIGSTFTVTLDNATVTYSVSNIVIFEKNQETGKLTLNGAGSHMNNVARAKHNGVQYDLSLMTCYGQSLGYGDATHRLVIFANRIQ